jgi:hypothetical protein
MLGAKENMQRKLTAKTPAAGSAKMQILAVAALICGFTGCGSLGAPSAVSIDRSRHRSNRRKLRNTLFGLTPAESGDLTLARVTDSRARHSKE